MVVFRRAEKAVFLHRGPANYGFRRAEKGAFLHGGPDDYGFRGPWQKRSCPTPSVDYGFGGPSRNRSCAAALLLRAPRLSHPTLTLTTTTPHLPHHHHLHHHLHPHGVREAFKVKGLYDSQAPVCPVCQTLLRPGEFQEHMEQELAKVAQLQIRCYVKSAPLRPHSAGAHLDCVQAVRIGKLKKRKTRGNASDVDLDVDGDDTLEYGRAQYPSHVHTPCCCCCCCFFSFKEI
ncbi:hypothetical protein CRUP_020370 [Coryphaenoides rupestris]|nr:hypothetical protein CRUP_020370 [Coryphaenoides rupestris]